MSNGHVKADELQLMRRALELDAPLPVGRDLWTYEELDQTSRRWEYILEKWVRKGWWECGVSVRAGWLTDQGREALPKMIEETERRHKLLETT